jgi:hypothetical protein
MLGALIYGVVAGAREWSGPLRPVAEIHLEPRYLPLYTMVSLERGVIAYGISFSFTIVYGYVMARVKWAERFLLPVLDLLQSIPVLGFLPGFVLALAHLFPHRNLGLELASVLMIFTGQVWNMNLFVLLLAQVSADGPGRCGAARQNVMVGAFPPNRLVVCSYGTCLEQHDVNGGRLVLPYGERGIRFG